MMSSGSSKQEQRLLDNGYEDVIFLPDEAYDDALIGVTESNQAVYNYDLMVEGLIRVEGMTEEEAMDWISYNTIRALPYMGEDAPIIFYPFME